MTFEDYTVTIVGAEEDDGEAPYLYVVRAETRQAAAAIAELAHREQDPEIMEVRSVTVTPGLPTYGHWNDLREPEESDHLAAVLAEVDKWETERREISESDEGGAWIDNASAWADSDDAAVDLLRDLVHAVRSAD